MSTTSVLIAGSGGQGILFAGKLLAQAAMLEDKNVTWFPSYGAEVRGGTANCTVIVSDTVIGSPVASAPDAIAVMNEPSLRRFQGRARKLIMLDSTAVKTPPDRSGIETSRVPAGELAIALGNPLSANMVLVGALAKKMSLCKLASLERALEELTPRGRQKNLPANIAALRKGWECAKDSP